MKRQYIEYDSFVRWVWESNGIAAYFGFFFRFAVNRIPNPKSRGEMALSRMVGLHCDQSYGPLPFLNNN